MLLQGPAMDAAVHALFTAMREFRLWIVTRLVVLTINNNNNNNNDNDNDNNNNNNNNNK